MIRFFQNVFSNHFVTYAVQKGSTDEGIWIGTKHQSVPFLSKQDYISFQVLYKFWNQLQVRGQKRENEILIF